MSQTTPPHPLPFLSQESPGKDLGQGPARGQEEPLPECQTLSRPCLPHSSHLGRRMRMTGNPRGSATPSSPKPRLRLSPSHGNSWDGLPGLQASQPLLPLEGWRLWRAAPSLPGPSSRSREGAWWEEALVLPVLCARPSPVCPFPP